MFFVILQSGFKSVEKNLFIFFRDFIAKQNVTNLIFFFFLELGGMLKQ